MATPPASRYNPGVRYLTWPNAVTALRFPLAAAFMGVETTSARLVILAAGAISDWLDGFLARKLQQSSRAGELLDPLADKVFVLAGVVTFAIVGTIRPWELLVLVARDVYASFAFVLARLQGWPVAFRARLSGKIVTALQIVAILVLLLWPQWRLFLVLAVGAASIYAIIDYTRHGLASIRRRPPAAPATSERTNGNEHERS